MINYGTEIKNISEYLFGIRDMKISGVLEALLNYKKYIHTRDPLIKSILIKY